MLRMILALFLLGWSSAAFAKATGVDSRPFFPPLGCGSTATGETLGCHFTDANAALTVTIDGPTHLLMGAQDTYTASIPVGAFQLQGAGINVAFDEPNTTGCQLQPVAAQGFGPLQFINDPDTPGPEPVLSHVHVGDPPPINLIGIWAYQFLVQNCTTPGAVALRVAMNAFDGNGAEDGEIWNFEKITLTVPEPGVALLGVGAVATIVALGSRRRS